MARGALFFFCCLIAFPMANVFGQAVFTGGPLVQKDNANIRISFTVSETTDVAITVLDSNGQVIRHLAAGVLNNNAPAPLQAGSLSQSLVWDRVTDNQATYGSDSFTVKVGLGLSPQFDRIVGWNPKAIKKVHSVAVGPGGELFVLWESGYDAFNPPGVMVFSRSGEYLRTLIPYPGNLSDAALAGVGTVKLDDGRRLPLQYNSNAHILMPFWNGICHQTMLVTPSGQLVMNSGSSTYLGGTRRPRAPLEWGTGPRRLLIMNTDGSIPQDFGGPTLVEPKVMTGLIHLGLSPNGKTVYAAGLMKGDAWSTANMTPSQTVLKVNLDGTGPATIFAGVDSVAGSDNLHFNDPRGIAVDAQGDVYVADHGNNRIVRFDSLGNYVGAIAVEYPHAIALNKTSGAVYVVSVNHGTSSWASGGGWVNKKVLKITSWSNPTIASTLNAWNSSSDFQYAALSIAVDEGVSPPIVWIGNGFPSPYHGTGTGVWRCVDSNGVLTAPQCVIGPLSGQKGIESALALAVNPTNEDVHVITRQGKIWQCFNGKTGASLTGPAVGGVEREFADDGSLFLRKDGGGNCAGLNANLAHYTSAGTALKFDSLSGNEIRLPPYTVSGGTCDRGFDVAPNGDIYFRHFDDTTCASAESKSPQNVDVYGKDGKLKQSAVISGMLLGGSAVRVDHDGNIYVADNIKPANRIVPLELQGKYPIVNFTNPNTGPGLWETGYPWIYGSLLKFGPGGGSVDSGGTGDLSA